MAAMAHYPRPALPRLHFTGKFFSDPSTINNDPRHYDVANFRPNYQLLRDAANENGSWNPEGGGSFAFVTCSVSAVRTYDGLQVADDPGLTPDPLLGERLIGNDRSVQAKMSDLDPQMQFASEIWGLRLRIGTEKSGFHGLVHVCAFQDMWPSLPSGEEFTALSAVYQSVIKLGDLQVGDSQFLMECQPYIDISKSVMGDDGKPLYPNGALSIRFRLDNYNGTFDSAEFRYGQVTGTIMPWLTEEPISFNAGRALRAIPNPAGLPNAMTAYGHVQEDYEGKFSVYIDMSNSMVRNSHYEFRDIGPIFLVNLPNGYSPTTVLDFQRIGEIDYRAKDWLKTTGGIAEVPLTADQKAAIEKPGSLLAVISVPRGVPSVLLVEPNDAIFTKPDVFVVRLNAGEESSTKLYATSRGQRMKNSDVLVGLDSSLLHKPGGPLPGKPESAIIVNGKTPEDGKEAEFTTTVKTDNNGIAKLTLKGGQVNNFRKYMDGQVYGIRMSAGEKLPLIGSRNPASDMVNVLVWDKYDKPEKPSWLVDIYPIFKQYANLYPSMDTIVSLDDYGSVVMRRIALERAFSADQSDPHYMPVTRDLSEDKRQTIVQWLTDVNDKDEPLYMNIERVADVEAALQVALEVEHATLPPYLTALFSIKQGYNQYVADALRDVSMEEMVHFAWAANILIAIGGKPNISKMGFVPKYPGPLPGGLRRGLIARLRKCSVEQIAAFMAIEAPDVQYQTDRWTVKKDADTEQHNRYTIGFLYDQIADALTELNKVGADGKRVLYFPDDIKAGEDDPVLKNQVIGWVGPRSIDKIRTLPDALHAIEIIKEEGEGATPTSPTDGVKDPKTGLPQLSHYFRFAEIVNGRRIVMDKETMSFSYTGDKIELDEEGIFNMQDDPNVKLLPNGSKARERMESFSRKYQAMLNGLDKTFNGDPDFLTQAIAAMYQLTIAAKPLMEMPALNLDGTPKEDGTTAGVSFQMPYADDF